MIDDENDPIVETGDPSAGTAPKPKDIVPRDVPTGLDESRKNLVSLWTSKVQSAKKHWNDGAFQRMREDQDFAFGKQWPQNQEKKYTANIVLRHVNQRVAGLYAKNPKVVARTKKRLDTTIWDGSMASLNAAMQAAQMGDPSAMMIVQDAMAAKTQRDQVKKLGETLVCLYEHNVYEQVHPMKQMLKMTMRRAVTTGVGYIKLGFQRIMGTRAEQETRIADIQQRLDTLQRINADMHDDQTKDNDAEIEQLRLLLSDMQKQEQAIVREGLVLDYPTSTSIIIDPKCKNLRRFLGADWVAQEYILTPDEIQEVYGVDVGKKFKAYKREDMTDVVADAMAMLAGRDTNSEDAPTADCACVWEIYNRKDGLVYTICDGWPDFLEEPSSPDVQLERFWPWFPIVLNECDHEKEIFPPSDVRLMMDMQKELNRSRQGLREHRIANRPKTAVAAGQLDQTDKDKLESHPANAVIELNALSPGQSIDQVLQPIRLPGLDPNLYEVNPVFEDLLRVLGVQSSQLGGVGNSTATESNIAEASRTQNEQSNVDDLDEVLTELAKEAGHILLENTSPEIVMKIVGPGAVWPSLTREQIMQDLYLDVEAGSSGRPNQAQELQNFERIVPLLLQIPGITPEFLAKEGIRRLDDRINLEDAFAAGLPSIIAQNAMKNMMPGPGTNPEDNPEAQGPEGQNNAPSGPEAPGANGPSAPNAPGTPGGALQ